MKTFGVIGSRLLLSEYQVKLYRKTELSNVGLIVHMRCKLFSIPSTSHHIAHQHTSRQPPYSMLS